MKDSKVLAFIFGLIPMTLIQYCYWNWLIHGLTDKDFGNAYVLFIAPMIVAFFYCVYEKYIVYSAISDGTTFRDRIPLAILWILECIIGIRISLETVYHQIPHTGYGGSFSGLVTVWCLITGVIAMVSFLLCRLFLHSKNKEVKQVLLVMLAIWLLRIVFCALMDYDYYI